MKFRGKRDEHETFRIVSILKLTTTYAGVGWLGMVYKHGFKPFENIFQYQNYCIVSTYL